MGVYPMIYTDVTIKNTGSVAITGSIGAQQWLSNDTVVDASDTPMGFKSYSATLLVGQSMTLRVAGTFQSTSPCKPFLVVKADPLNAVVESSESDNFGSTPFTGWSDRGCP